MGYITFYIYRKWLQLLLHCRLRRIAVEHRRTIIASIQASEIASIQTYYRDVEYRSDCFDKAFKQQGSCAFFSSNMHSTNIATRKPSNYAIFSLNRILNWLLIQCSRSIFYFSQQMRLFIEITLQVVHHFIHHISNQWMTQIVSLYDFINYLFIFVSSSAIYFDEFLT